MKLLPTFWLLALLAVAYAIDCGKESSEEEDDKEFDEIAKKNEGLWDKINKDQSKKQGFAFRAKSKDDRKKMFKEKAKEAKEANKKNPKFCQKAGEMDALDDDEFQNEFLGADLSQIGKDSDWPEEHRGFGEDAALKDLPASVDHSEATGPVESQGGCGSCWAFAASHTLTGVVAKVGIKKVIDYSEQQITDCTYPGKGGCQGGWMNKAWDYLKTKNFMLEKDYPYTGRSDGKSCKDSGAKGEPFVTGSVRVRGEAEMRKVVAKHPISLAMLVGKGGFGRYKSGVYDYDGDDCKVLNHAMTITGYGTENGEDYWMVKNSWGGRWGNNGYIKIKRGKNLCNIERYAMYPTVKAGGGGGGDDDKGDDDDKKPTTTTTPAPFVEWKKYENLEYINQKNTRMSFELAEQFCLQNGGNLASITSKEQLETFKKLKRNVLRINGRVWIGLNDREQEGKWKWTDESPVSYTNWGNGEPNNWRGQEDCAETGGDRWNDVRCANEREFICVKWNK